MENIRNDEWVNLPKDVWGLITNGLDSQSLRTLEKVCKFLKDQVLNEIWKAKSDAWMSARQFSLNTRVINNYKNFYCKERILFFGFSPNNYHSTMSSSVAAFQFYPQGVLLTIEISKAQLIKLDSQQTRTFSALRYNDSIESASMDTSLNRLVSGSLQGLLRIHNLADKSHQNLTHNHNTRISSVNFYNETIISVDRTGRVIAQQINPNNLQYSFAGIVHNPNFAPIIVGKCFIACNTYGGGGYGIWDAETGKQKKIGAFSSPITHIATHPASGFVAFGAGGGDIEIINTKKIDAVPISIKIHDTAIVCMAFDTDEKILSLSQKGNCIKEYDLRTGKKCVLAHESGGLSSFTIHDDMLYLADRYGAIHIVDRNTGEKLRFLEVSGCSWIYRLEVLDDKLFVIYEHSDPYFSSKNSTFSTLSQMGKVAVFDIAFHKEPSGT